jgi:hypothetical protein
MRSVTAKLNRAGIAFQLKALKDPCGYTRCDAAVLYLRKADLEIAASFIGETYRALASELKPLTPSLTQKIGDGLGFAEDPGYGERGTPVPYYILDPVLILVK